jgi:hypothetical protein
MERSSNNFLKRFFSALANCLSPPRPKNGADALAQYTKFAEKISAHSGSKGLSDKGRRRLRNMQRKLFGRHAINNSEE